MKTHQEEHVADIASWRQFGPKAQRREELVTVVVLDDFADRAQRPLVVVLSVRAVVMQRGVLPRISVGCGEVYGDCAVNLAAEKGVGELIHRLNLVAIPIPCQTC